MRGWWWCEGIPKWTEELGGRYFRLKSGSFSLDFCAKEASAACCGVNLAIE
jgi:hypothetical protein